MKIILSCRWLRVFLFLSIITFVLIFMVNKPGYSYPFYYPSPGLELPLFPPIYPPLPSCLISPSFSMLFPLFHPGIPSSKFLSHAYRSAFVVTPAVTPAKGLFPGGSKTILSVTSLISPTLVVIPSPLISPVAPLPFVPLISSPIVPAVTPAGLSVTTLIPLSGPLPTVVPPLPAATTLPLPLPLPFSVPVTVTTPILNLPAPTVTVIPQATASLIGLLSSLLF